MGLKQFLIAAFLMVFAALPVHAHCPLCTAAVGASAVTAKYFGVETSIIGVLIGAFGISSGLWIALNLKKYVKFQTALIVMGSFLLTVLPLTAAMPDSAYFPVLIAGSPGTLLNKVYWVNEMLIGSMLGAIAALTAFALHMYIKKSRGKVLFPFQGVVLTIAAILVMAIMLYIT